MAKEWILNQANMRWGLTRKKQVGAVSEAIRECSPGSIEEWERYYYEKIYPREHLVELGRRVFTKITEVCRAEIEAITEEDCIDFIINLVINRTYDGYQSEIQTIYGQLQMVLERKIEPAPDEWDRKYSVDFFIRVGGKYIGIQIKPAGPKIILTEYTEGASQEKHHKRFTEQYGGKVFYVYSIKKDDKRVILNTNIIGQIKEEIEKLEKEQYS